MSQPRSSSEGTTEKSIEKSHDGSSKESIEVPLARKLLDYAHNGDKGGMRTIPIETTDDLEQTALHLAASEDDCKAIDVLINHGADINALASEGETPLIIAIQFGQVATTTALLQHHPNLDIRDTIFGQSAISYAAESGNAELVKLLINANCDIYSAKAEQFPPLERAAQRGNHDILQLFFEHHSDGHDVFRSQAIAEALCHAYDKGYPKTYHFITDPENSFLTARDEDGRTVLSWIAATGSEELVGALLLLTADIDLGDNNKRSPLSFAAQRGNLAVIRQFLSRKERDAQVLPESPERNLNINSKSEDKGWTPLWYAVQGGHIKVAEALLENGAEPKIYDNDGRDLMKFIDDTELQSVSDGASIKSIGNMDGVRKLLEPFFSLLTDLLDQSEGPDQKINAMMSMFHSADMDVRPVWKSVAKLLTSQGEQPLSQDISTQWLHLPANNMRWVEVVLKRHNESCGSSYSHLYQRILKPTLWADNQNLPRDGTRWHERFMRAGCHVLPLSKVPSTQCTVDMTPTEKQNDAGFPDSVSPTKTTRGEQMQTSTDYDVGIVTNGVQRNEDQVTNPKGFVLFMPYLHWERSQEVDKFKRICENFLATLPSQTEDSGEDDVETSQQTELSTTEELLLKYLGEKHPIHIRRTLDEYYYPDSSTLDVRKEDQTTVRWFREQFKPRACDPDASDSVLTMVDQLWMWVLPKCGQSPPTIVTAFPQGSNIGQKKSRTVLLNNIIAKCGDFYRRSLYDVAEVIVAECSRIYFDSTSNRPPTTQFLDVFRSSIGKIVENDIERFGQFQDTIRLLTRLPEAKPPIPRSKVDHLNTNKDQDAAKAHDSSQEGLKPSYKPKESLDNDQVLERLLNIENDIEDLRRIKDIRDELNMMRSLFNRQQGVIQEMWDITHDHVTQREGSHNGIENTAHDTLGFTSPYLPQAVIRRNLDEVGALDEFAKRTGDAIEQLLGLKQQQADLLLTKAIYKINDATDKQGKTIMAFTLVTVLFLPLSFMASFLALNVSQFPWHGDGDNAKLSLDWVVKIILSVSLPLSIAFFVLAFNTTHSQRKNSINAVRNWKSKARKAVPRVPHFHIKLSHMWRRKHNKTKDPENGNAIPGTSELQRKVTQPQRG